MDIADRELNSITDETKSNVFSQMRQWLQPRSTDRDEAFRERIIRSTVALIVFFGVASLLNTVFVYGSEWGIISFPTLYIYTLLWLLGAGFAVSKQMLVRAGWLLVIGVLFGITIAMMLASQDKQFATIFIGLPAYLLVPLIAAIVLPRENILVVTVISIVTAGAVQFLALPADGIGLADYDTVIGSVSMLVILLLEGALLRLFRVEFDARLNAMSVSIEQERVAREQANAARLRAEQADNAKSQFLANMSHELRTPLNAIIGYDEAMLGGMVGEFEPKQLELLGHIQHNGRRLLGLINDVLDLSKIESGSLQVYSAPFVPRKLISDAVKSLSSLAEEKKIVLETNFADSIPEIVLGDARKIEQILTNLVGNSLKFTSEGGVYVDTRPVGHDRWSISVRDTGIGIDDKALPTIFEPFKQADNSSTRKYKGTGLGLSITKKLVEIMDGTLDVETEVGKGTIFTVTLPRAYRQEAEEATEVDKPVVSVSS